MIGDDIKMKVYYSASLWDRPRGKAGTKQVLNWSFNHLGKKRIIPCIYRFSKGIVFDIITPLEEDELKAFVKKAEEINEEELSENQRRQLEQEHPYRQVSLAEIWINGEWVQEGFESTSSISMPFLRSDETLMPLSKVYRSSLKDGACFACQRIRVSYPREATGIQKLKRRERGDKINSLKLVTREENIFYPLEQQFELSEAKSHCEIKFLHPTTGKEHTLYFQREENFEVPRVPTKEERFYVTTAVYEITPPLGEGEHLEFDTSMSYKRQSTHPYAPESTSSIAIIGGARGPTSLFIAGREKEERKGTHNLPLQYCFSKMSIEESNSKMFVLQGLIIKESSRELYEYKYNNF